uniref:Reverse transcriptase zinc-binding domain-containing protein n=1 Tax=Chenopodium quinoa TaxID=63459 RepID=A0A803LZB6_CHEQI
MPFQSHFLRSANKRNLAVKERLHYRHIVPDMVCPVCGAPNEFILHSLFECNAVADKWSHCVISWNTGDIPSSSFSNRWVWLTKKLKANELRTMATLMWAAHGSVATSIFL